jgi:hypothetical protein
MLLEGLNNARICALIKIFLFCRILIIGETKGVGPEVSSIGSARCMDVCVWLCMCV